MPGGEGLRIFGSSSVTLSRIVIASFVKPKCKDIQSLHSTPLSLVLSSKWGNGLLGLFLRSRGVWAQDLIQGFMHVQDSYDRAQTGQHEECKHSFHEVAELIKVQTGLRYSKTVLASLFLAGQRKMHCSWR